MDQILSLLNEYKILLATAGGLAAVAMLICFALNQLEWLTIWNWCYLPGKAVDKILSLKFSWLEKLFENIGVLGLIPAIIAFFAGSTENNMTLRLKLKTSLTEMAAKL